VFTKNPSKIVNRLKIVNYSAKEVFVNHCTFSRSLLHISRERGIKCKKIFDNFSRLLSTFALLFATFYANCGLFLAQNVDKFLEQGNFTSKIALFKYKIDTFNVLKMATKYQQKIFHRINKKN